MSKRKGQTYIVNNFIDLFDLPDFNVKTLCLYFDIPFIFLIDIDTDENRVRFVSQLLKHRLGIKISRDLRVINANDYYEKFINTKL